MKSTIIACFIVWLVTATTSYLVSSWYDFNQGAPSVLAKKAVAECEKSLPRDQTCKWVITAVPK